MNNEKWIVSDRLRLWPNKKGGYFPSNHKYYLFSILYYLLSKFTLPPMGDWNRPFLMILFLIGQSCLATLPLPGDWNRTDFDLAWLHLGYLTPSGGLKRKDISCIFAKYLFYLTPSGGLKQVLQRVRKSNAALPYPLWGIETKMREQMFLWCCHCYLYPIWGIETCCLLSF